MIIILLIIITLIKDNNNNNTKYYLINDKYGLVSIIINEYDILNQKIVKLKCLTIRIYFKFNKLNEI